MPGEPKLGILHAAGLVESFLMHRRTATKVRHGRVQRKNRWTRPVNAAGPNGVAIERARPGVGYVHAVTQDEVYSFVQNLTDWPRLSVGLNKIILEPGCSGWYGYYHSGVIGLRAFYGDLTIVYAPDKKSRDRDFFDMVTVDVEYELDPAADEQKVDRVVYHLTRPMARAFMLVHVLSHELGHHLDRMTNHLRNCPHGEPFAYRYEWAQAPHFWRTYLRVFGDPRQERC